MDEMNLEQMNDDWFETLNSRVNGELGLARRSYHTTHQWVITLTVGLITAVLALGKEKIVYPTEFSLLAVLAITPLMIRFFVRSCLEFAIFYRWKMIRDALDTYFCLDSSTHAVLLRATGSGGAYSPVGRVVRRSICRSYQVFLAAEWIGSAWRFAKGIIIPYGSRIEDWGTV